MLTIGAFDGVHLGHRALIGTVVQRARAFGYQSAVLTFDPHPDLVIHPERGRLYLSSLDERAALLEELGVDLLVVMPFTEEIKQWTALEFMQRLCGALAVRELYVGSDFALGRKREGTVPRLQEIGASLGYRVIIAELLPVGGERASSSRVRAALTDGDVEEAARLLGRPFSLSGEVIHGDQRGRTIGFPTANLAIDERHVLPANGVYVCRTEIDGQVFGAVTNIGTRPTFDGTRRTVEAYVLDFAGDLYGEHMRLQMLHRLRGEHKFNGIAELVEQISRDTAAARAWLANNPLT